MEEKFTLEEIRKYLITQDSLGDAVYNLKPSIIKWANSKDADPLGEDCCHFDCAQGRNLCTCEQSRFVICDGCCEYFEPK